MPYIANPLEGLPIRNSFVTDQDALGAAPATDDTLVIYDLSTTSLKQLTIANLQAGIVASPAFTGVPTAPTANAGTNTTQVATTAFVTTANAALNTIAEMTDVTISGIQSAEVLKWNGSAWINQTLVEANILSIAGPTFTGVLTVGSAVISETDLEQIDDLTPGTAVALKALVVDNNKDIGTIRNLTIDGVFTDGNYTFATDGSVSGLGTIASGAITSSGVIKTDSTTNATSITDGSLQTDGGLSVALDAILGDDLTLISDAAILNFGVNSDVSLTHVHDTGLLLNSSRKIQFGDAGTFIHQSADGVLTIESDTTVDINGAVIFNGALSGITNITISGTLSDGNYTFDTNGNVSGLGTVASDTHTIGSLVVAAASITDTSGTISFGNENLTTTGVVTAGGITLGSAVLIETELELLDDVSVGTAIASKVVTTDSNIDTTGQRNLTITGELDAATLDISGDADIDGTLEADVITVDGVALATYIRDTVGTNMLSSNVESGIAVTYDTSNDNIDFALDTAQTSLVTIYNAALKAGRDTDNLIDFATTDDEIILRVAGANEVRLAANILSPVTNDGIALGTGSLMWSDLFLADAGVINFNNSNMTITHTSAGLLTVAGGTLATAALTTSTIVASGIVKTDDATEATTTTDGSLQTDGGLSVVKDAVFGDDVKLLSDSAVLSFGADGDTTLTHTDGTGIGLNGTNKITFNDASQFIQGSSATVLSLGATAEIDLTATDIDINGDADVSGSLTAGSYVGLPAATDGVSGIAELATTAEIDTGTDQTRIMPIDQYVASNRNTRYIFVRIVDKDTDCEGSTTEVGGDFEFPFAGTLIGAGTFSDTTGSGSTMVVDINKNGSSILNAKCVTANGAQTTRGGSAVTFSDTALVAGNVITFDVDSVHTSTACKGLVVRLEVRVT